MKALAKIQERRWNPGQEEEHPDPEGPDEGMDEPATEPFSDPDAEEPLPEAKDGPAEAQQEEKAEVLAPEEAPALFPGKTNGEAIAQPEPETAGMRSGNELPESLTARPAESPDARQPENQISSDRIHADTIVLLKYALGTGRKIPEKIAGLLHQNTWDSMIQVHQELSSMIRPAIPRSVLYLEQQQTKQHRLKFIGLVPTVAHFMLTGMISFAVLVASSCSPLVNETNLAHGLLNSSGLSLLMNLLFISSVSCLGAVFSILPKINWQIRHATYLPESNMYYWSMLMLGVFGGLIMGELLSLSYDIPGTPVKFDAIVFSLMGGFASESVFLILKTLMAKVQQLVTGETREQA